VKLLQPLYTEYHLGLYIRHIIDISTIMSHFNGLTYKTGETKLTDSGQKLIIKVLINLNWK